jgi:hypothetical protein
MCWSGEASTVLAVLGFAGTAYAAYKKEPPQLYLSLGYFTLMEALQAFTYSVIDQCTLPSNQIATLLGYLHIAFQPFFINAVSMYFIPRELAVKIEKPVYFLCFVSAIFMIVQLYPFEWSQPCIQGRMMCAPSLCSVSGNWHIAWNVPVNDIGNWFIRTQIHPLNGYITYAVIGFALPVLYGSWRFTAYHYLLGPTLAKALTDNINEAPAVWCLLSIGLLLVVVKSPIRRFLFVRSWPLWTILGFHPQRVEKSGS